MYGFKGLGDLSPTDYLAACMAGHPNECPPVPAGAPMTDCLAAQLDADAACMSRFYTDPGNTEPLTDAALAKYLAAIADANRTASTPLPTTSQGDPVVSSSAPPTFNPGTVTQSSGDANKYASVPRVASGFNFSSIPWWAYAGAAAVALLAFKK